MKISVGKNGQIALCACALILLLAACRSTKGQDGSAGTKPSPGAPIASTAKLLNAVPSDFRLTISTGARSPDQPWDRIVVIMSDGTVLFRENSAREHPRVFDAVLKYTLEYDELYDIYATAKKEDIYSLNAYYIDEEADKSYARIEYKLESMAGSIFKSVKLPRFDRTCIKVNQYLPAGCEIEFPSLAEYPTPPKLLRKKVVKQVDYRLAISLYLNELETLPTDEKVHAYYCLAYLYAKNKDVVQAKKYAEVYKMVGVEADYLRLEKMIAEIGQPKKG